VSGAWNVLRVSEELFARDPGDSASLSIGKPAALRGARTLARTSGDSTRSSAGFYLALDACRTSRLPSNREWLAPRRVAGCALLARGIRQVESLGGEGFRIFTLWPVSEDSGSGMVSVRWRGSFARESVRSSNSRRRRGIVGQTAAARLRWFC